MARLAAYVPVNIGSSGDALGGTFDNAITTRMDSSGMAWQYTLNGSYVFSASITGSFALTPYSASGTITSMTFDTIAASPALVIDSMNARFASIYGLSSALSFDNVFSGADSMFGSDGRDVLSARGGNDVVIAMGGNDSVTGGEGNDDTNGNMGDDTVSGGSGDDLVRGGKDQDIVYGDAGNDMVNGNIGNDTVYGGVGNDEVFGGQNDDVLYGEAGGDTLSGDLGNDTLYGGAEGDLFLFRADGGADLIADFSLAEGDRLRCAPGMSYSIGAEGADALIAFSGGSSVRISGAAGMVTANWFVA